MTTLTINGRSVTVSDDFLSLTPEEQDATVEEIAANMRIVHDVPEFDPGIEGYNPGTGNIERAASQGSTAVSGAIEGLPIVGAPLVEGVKSMSAGIGSTLTGQPYEQVRAEMDDMVQRGNEQNPGTRTLANVTGAVAGTIPMVMAAPTAFGAGAGNVFSSSLWSLGSGATLGGTDAAVRSGGDPDAIWKGVQWGGGTGAAGPAAGKLIGAGMRYGHNAFLNNSVARALGISRRTAKDFGGAFARDAIDPASLPSRLSTMGDDAMIMDVSPTLQQKAGAIATTLGRGQEIVRSMVAARDAMSPTRIRSGIDDAIGQAKTPGQVAANAKASRKALSPEYEAVFARARRVDTSKIAEELDSQIVNLRGPAQKAIKDVRDMLKIVGTDELDPNPATLHQTRQAIDGLLSTEKNSQVQRVLRLTRKQIDGALGEAVPGIKAVDAKYRDIARQGEAFKEGQHALGTGKTAIPPDDLRATIGKYADSEGASAMLRDGARADIERIIGNKILDPKGLQRSIVGKGVWAQDKLEALFGKESADKVMSILNSEAAFADTSKVVGQGVRSGARSAARQELPSTAINGNGTELGFVADGWKGAGRAATLRALKKAFGTIKSGSGDVANEDLAKLLSANQRDKIVQELMRLNGGRRIPQSQVNGVVRALLAGPTIAGNVPR